MADKNLSDVANIEDKITLNDVTTLNSTSLLHGFLPKLSNDPDTYLDGEGNYSGITWAQVNKAISDLADLVTKNIEDLDVSDNTTNDVSITAHGLAPKLPNNAARFLDGVGAYDTIKDADLVTTDVTTNNATDLKHGFLPKLSGVDTEFLNGDGLFSTPAGGGSPAGSDREVQFNNAGSFGADDNLSYAATPGLKILTQGGAFGSGKAISIGDDGGTTRFTIELPSSDLNTLVLTGARIVLATSDFTEIDTALKIGLTQVLTAQQAAVADASGGAIIDAEARTALNSLLAKLRTHGLIAT